MVPPVGSRRARLAGRVKAVLGAVLLVVVLPVLIFLLLEAVVRLSGVDTEVVKSDKYRVGVPLWAYDEANTSLVRDVYRQILDNDQSAASAEWLALFTDAPRLHYKMKPRIKALVSNTVNKRELERGIKVRIESNARGFRTGEWPTRKPPNTYRIVFLGDSATFGWGVNAEERFSELLAARLNAFPEGPRVEAINLGLPGYTTYHALRLLKEEVFRYEPDMLVVSYGANDGRTVPVSVKRGLRQSGFIGGVKDFLGRFKAYRLLRKKVLGLYNPFDRAAGAQRDEPQAAFVATDEYARNLEAIIDQAAAHGARTILLGLCCPLDYLAKMTSVGRRKGVPAFDGMYLMMEALPAIQRGLLEPEKARFYEDLYGREILAGRRILYVTSDSCHPNVLGHLVLAEALAKRAFLGQAILAGR
jgi:lysophospholipase L1-like esterase